LIEARRDITYFTRTDGVRSIGQVPIAAGSVQNHLGVTRE
jgi:hypothetical protein